MSHFLGRVRHNKITTGVSPEFNDHKHDLSTRWKHSQPPQRIIEAWSVYPADNEAGFTATLTFTNER